jgi:hypothetical protein
VLQTCPVPVTPLRLLTPPPALDIAAVAADTTATTPHATHEPAAADTPTPTSTPLPPSLGSKTLAFLLLLLRKAVTAIAYFVMAWCWVFCLLAALVAKDRAVESFKCARTPEPAAAADALLEVCATDRSINLYLSVSLVCVDQTGMGGG